MNDETELRQMAATIVENIADRAASAGYFVITNVDEFIAACQEVEHYLSDGQDVAFKCEEGSIKFVRGQ